MKFDFHTHHDRCGHARGSIEDYIRQAIRCGLQIIGISDHSPFFADAADHSNPRIAMAKSEFPRYVEEVLRLKAKYADQIEVALGVESDYYPQHEDLYRRTYEPYPFDYLIGSIHSVNRIGVFNRERWQNTTEEQQLAIKNEYYKHIQLSVRSGLFQIVGHMDAMKSYYPAFSAIATPEVDATLRLIAERGMAIEINTSYDMKKANWAPALTAAYPNETDWYPSDEMLERAHHYGVHVTFGSDSHDPERVADDFEQVRARLREIGYREWAIFRQKHLELVPL